MLVKQALSSAPGGCRNALLRPTYRQSGKLVLSPVSRSHLYTQQPRSKKLEGNSQNALSFCRQLSISRTTFASPTSEATVTAALKDTPKEAIIESDPHPIDQPYAPPTTGLLSKLPPSWVPYAELIRLDKPTGTYYLFWPCLFSTLMAAPVAAPMVGPSTIIYTTALFFSGALVMRGAGCAINDLWDRNLDKHVRRTRLRPIARGALTPKHALIFTGSQMGLGLAILLQFPTSCLYYGAASLPLVAAYPLMKRITNYPQAVLGLTFSWGAIIGFPAMGVDLLTDHTAAMACGLLYASNIAWTVLYDMIYAHMDIKDDAKAGIKSIALRHDADTKKVLTGLGIVQVGLLAAAGVVSGAGPAFFVGSCGGTALTLAWMIRSVNLKSVRDCWWWFKNGCLITGGTLASGLAVDYVLRYNLDGERALAEKKLQLELAEKSGGVV